MSTFTIPATVRRGMAQSLCSVLLLLTCGALPAQREEHRVRNIVLVHGAWPVAPYLVESGAPGLLLMTAGATDAALMGAYQRQVGRFDWVGFLGRYPFAMAAFREMLSGEFRYCAIDSRTGVSDTAGICTSVRPATPENSRSRWRWCSPDWSRKTDTLSPG
jgi:hypothetical protein